MIAAMETIRVGDLGKLQPGTVISLTDSRNVGHSGEFHGAEFGPTPSLYRVNLIESGERITIEANAAAPVTPLKKDSRSYPN